MLMLIATSSRLTTEMRKVLVFRPLLADLTRFLCIYYLEGLMGHTGYLKEDMAQFGDALRIRVPRLDLPQRYTSSAVNRFKPAMSAVA